MHVMEEKAMIMFSKASHGESKWVTILLGSGTVFEEFTFQV